MVQKANILYYQLENVGSGILSEADIKKYKAEAVFLRNLAYFFMVRVWGDVPYYTQAFHSTPSPRVNFVEVLQKVLQICLPIIKICPGHTKINLSWQYGR